MSFERRKLSVTVYPDGNSAKGASNAITMDGYRMLASIVTNGGMATGQAQVQVFGLPLNQINSLTRIQNTASAQKSGVMPIEIYASEGNNAPSLAFSGNVWWAWGQFESAPDTSFIMHCHAGYPLNLITHPVTSFKGTVNASDVVQKLASAGGFGFQNNGVTAQISEPYLIGSVIRQMRMVQHAARFNLDIDRGVVYIWPRKSYRSGTVPVIGPGNKMVGYPRQSSSAIAVRAEFLPEAHLGGRVTVEGSQLTTVNGTWVISSASHTLSAEMPGGPWFTDMNLQYLALGN